MGRMKLSAPSPWGSSLGKAARSSYPYAHWAPRAATEWGLGRAPPSQVFCPMEGICLQLWPCLLRSWGPGSQWSSALEELNPGGEPRKAGGPRGHRAQSAGKGEHRGRGPKAASGHQGPPGSSQGDGEWGCVVRSGGWKRPPSPPSSQGSVPPAELQLLLPPFLSSGPSGGSAAQQWGQEDSPAPGPSNHCGNPLPRAPIDTGHAQVSICLGSYFNQSPVPTRISGSV